MTGGLRSEQRDCRPGAGARAHRQPLKAGKGEEMDSLLEPPEEACPANSSLTSDLQNCERYICVA